jgi:hypothetical protein
VTCGGALFIPQVRMINPFLPRLSASPEQSNSGHELPAPGWGVKT